MRRAIIQRPVTPAKHASVLGMKPYEVLGLLIPMQVFVAPNQLLGDSVAIEAAAGRGVDLKIRDEGDDSGGSASSPNAGPTEPQSPDPSGLSSHEPISVRPADSGTRPSSFNPESGNRT
jgi:hypothetical protein